jgi:hypothetical protein
MRIPLLTRNRLLLRYQAAAVLTLLATACSSGGSNQGVSDAGVDSAVDGATEVGEASLAVVVNEDPFSLQLKRDGKVLLETQGAVRLQHFVDSYPKVEKPYVRWTPGSPGEPLEARRVVSRRSEGEWAIYELAGTNGSAIVEFRYRLVAGQGIRAEFNALGAPKEDARTHSRLTVAFRSDTEDTFYGMGMRFDGVNHRGAVVTNWAHEVGENLPKIAAAALPKAETPPTIRCRFFSTQGLWIPSR